MEGLEVYLAAVVLNGLWQVSLAAAAGWLASRLMRGGRGERQHLLMLGTAVVCALAPWLSSPWPVGGAQPVPAGWLWREDHGIVMDPLALWALSGLVLVACGARGLRILRAYLVVRRLRLGARADCGERIGELARRCGERLGVSGIKVLISGEVSGPVTVGIRHPAVLLPEGLLERLGEEVVEAALAHELMHVRRRDGARKLVEELLLSLVAWHPAAWWVSRRLDDTRELSCDEAAAQALGGGQRYSRSLVAIARELSAQPRMAAGLCSMGEGNLQERVEQLVAGVRRLSRWRMVAGSAALAGAAVSAGQVAVVPAAEGTPKQPVVSKRPSISVGELGEVPVRSIMPPPPPPPPPPGKPKK